MAPRHTGTTWTRPYTRPATKNDDSVTTDNTPVDIVPYVHGSHNLHVLAAAS